MPKPSLKSWPRSFRTGSDKDGTDPMIGVIAFGGLWGLLFIILNTVHIHGWTSFGLALPLAVLAAVVARLVMRRLKAATDLERRSSSNPLMGTRAEGRARARRRKQTNL